MYYENDKINFKQFNLVHAQKKLRNKKQCQTPKHTRNLFIISAKTAAAF
jgi:hypothetical protein